MDSHRKRACMWPFDLAAGELSIEQGRLDLAGVYPDPVVYMYRFARALLWLAYGLSDTPLATFDGTCTAQTNTQSISR